MRLYSQIFRTQILACDFVFTVNVLLITKFVSVSRMRKVCPSEFSFCQIEKFPFFEKQIIGFISRISSLNDFRLQLREQECLHTTLSSDAILNFRTNASRIEFSL